jgi:hypothetical protein
LSVDLSKRAGLGAKPSRTGGIRALPADYFPSYHATLLQRAAPIGFSRTALLFRVIPANIAVDLNQRDKRLHFDNSTFVAGVRHIEELWSRIEAGARRFANFGMLTHTVQDFYSHSNWVELHQHLQPIVVWDLDPSSLPAEVVSGTYPAVRGQSGDDTPTHAKLNKDSPYPWISPRGAQVVTEGPNRGRTLFDLGYAAALAATCVQFDRLMKVLRSSAGDETE